MNPKDVATSSAFWQRRDVHIGGTTYPYYFGFDCMDNIVAELAALAADRFVVVTDDTVLGLHGPALLEPLRTIAPVQVISHPPGESIKTGETLFADLELVLAAGATRRTVVIAFGGGVPGNLAGLLAALVFRGIRLVHLPTTTTAAMDSVLSLKQAINSSRGKNHIGTYLAPTAVLADVKLMATLPDRDLRSGMCEATKNCLAIQPQALPTLRRVLHEQELASPQTLLWLLDASAHAKASVTAEDPREQHSGLVLEYGHTVGHALELTDLRPAEQRLSHGEAIAFGMVVAARISHARGWLSAEELELHEELVGMLGAPVWLPEWASPDAVMERVRADNKRGYLPHGPSEVPFVLLEACGRPAGSPNLPLVLVELSEIRAALDDLTQPPVALATANGAAG